MSSNPISTNGLNQSQNIIPNENSYEMKKGDTAFGLAQKIADATQGNANEIFADLKAENNWNEDTDFTKFEIGKNIALGKYGTSFFTNENDPSKSLNNLTGTAKINSQPNSNQKDIKPESSMKISDFILNRQSSNIKKSNEEIFDIAEKTLLKKPSNAYEFKKSNEEIIEHIHNEQKIGEFLKRPKLSDTEKANILNDFNEIYDKVKNEPNKTDISQQELWRFAINPTNDELSRLKKKIQK